MPSLILKAKHVHVHACTCTCRWIGLGLAVHVHVHCILLIVHVGEVPCGCSEHVGRTIINDVYSCDVETMFKLIFTDSDFMRNFYKLENATSE